MNYFSRRNLIKRLSKLLLNTGFEHSIIHSIEISPDMIMITIQLPPHLEIAHLETILCNLKEELSAHDYKILEKSGKMVNIVFGKCSLNDVSFNSELIEYNSLKIPFKSSYGWVNLDFADDSSCHMLIGGVTRTGKSSLLLYLSTLLYLQNQENISIFITSTKAKDFYSLYGLPGVTITKDESELDMIIDSLLTEYQFRDSLLYSKTLARATNAKDVKKYYPEQYHSFHPMFLIIDEYARFSDNKNLQKKIQELVETAGYVNIHVIIASQRPDARTVLQPRIKSNLLARICFTTADKNNSIVILDHEGAEKLGRIQGRAILSDGESNIIQVPYISYDDVMTLTKDFKKEIQQNEKTNDYESQTGSDDPGLAEKIQNLFSKPDSKNYF